MLTVQRSVTGDWLVLGRRLRTREDARKLKRRYYLNTGKVERFGVKWVAKIGRYYISPKLGLCITPRVYQTRKEARSVLRRFKGRLHV